MRAILDIYWTAKAIVTDGEFDRVATGKAEAALRGLRGQSIRVVERKEEDGQEVCLLETPDGPFWVYVSPSWSYLGPDGLTSVQRLNKLFRVGRDELCKAHGWDVVSGFQTKPRKG